MNKKLLIVLVVVILLGAGIFTFRALKNSKGRIPVTDAKCFEFDSAKGEITGFNTVCGSKINIPAKIDGKDVKSIKSNVFNSKGLTILILPKGLETIGTNSFSQNELEEIVIPDTVKTIKPYAFESNKLKKITIPDGVTNIGFGAFNDNQMKDKDAFIYFRTDSGVDEEVLASYAGSERDNVKLPDSITQIYISAFSDCKINNVTLNDNLERIESRAFENNNIKSVTIPSKVMIINQAAFDSSIEEIIVKGKQNKDEFGVFDTTAYNENIIKYEGSNL